MEQVLLHGMLHVTIYEAEHVSGGRGREFIHEITEGIEQAIGLTNGGHKLYATIDIEQARVGRTRILEHEFSNPKWHEHFHIYCAHVASNIVFSVKRVRSIGAHVLGRAYLCVRDILGGEEVDTWLDVVHKEHDKSIHKGSRIHVKVQYCDVRQDLNWDKGIRTQNFHGVPYTYFGQRKGCKVTLYHDAHVDENFAPTIPLERGEYYNPHRCWEDIFDAITNAKHLIYIAGWSVCTSITLVRDPYRLRPGGDLTLGELLKKKAQEGVRVLMLVWNDRTSLKLLRDDGLMKTHDEDTLGYFQGSKVHCVLCSRNPDNGKSIIQNIEIATMFTHHQKTVVVDVALPNESSLDKRRIVSFVGGIDLCDGRYDTQSHSLFRTLNSIHRDDFHQPNFEDSSIDKGGPREAWHDIHSKLEGVVAWDVLFNFEQRWMKQGEGNDLLLDIKHMQDIFIPPSQITHLEDLETWNVQVFRSIDGGAAFGFPDSPEDAAKAGLVSGKDSTIDRSIQDAYINAIRRAKSFIYIENQYFLGSSFCWKQSDDIKVEDIGALHLIPKEISLKVVSKIEKGERFSVYIVVPMWPEGYPESGSVQSILDWQRRTMEMMYGDIAKALKAKGIEANPKDYLSFFCLGNREIKRGGEYEPLEDPDRGSDYSRAQIARRFMVYVHAKLMIVDDEYIIVGSANINQRSMDGGRDSEIAMGAYQPHHFSQQSQLARGQVHGFRMSLWFEHMGLLDEVFVHPESLECARKVNQIAQDYWEMYSSESIECDLPGHLLRYPVGVTQNGDVVELPGFQHFPDTNGRVLGEKSDLLPPILTS